eukprot:TRINITY_DN742_c1_g1_i6.p1 TRINITY_DN742_c1_g1~~TRINITY_DN742_c1_g1_i6.p1  ORF type:complete len:110 (+),score=0.02 TRINITY_DN742_c1_g1_i6:67-396(+)
MFLHPILSLFYPLKQKLCVLHLNQMLCVFPGDQLQQFTLSVCDSSVLTSEYVFASHTFTVLSTEAEAMCAPSGDQLQLITIVCDLRVVTSLNVFASHTFTVLSLLFYLQ